MNQEKIRDILIIINNVMKQYKDEENIDIQINLNEIETNFDEIGMSSIAFVAIIVSLEEKFMIEIPDEYLSMSELNSVKKIAEVLDEVLLNKEK